VVAQAPRPTATPRLSIPAQAAAVPTPTVFLPPPPAPIPEGPIIMSISLAGRSFNPHQVHGNHGQIVRVTLSGGTENHTFTIPFLGIDTSIAEGQSRVVEFTVPAEGIFPFYCRLHGTSSSGMHGLLIFH
jgi:plastocyanin